MSDFRKTRVAINAAYRDGSTFKENQFTPARINILDIPETDKFREVNLRLAVDSKDAEELMESLCRGNVSISIEQIPPLIER